MFNNVENRSPLITRSVIKEIHDLVKNPPECIEVQIKEENLTDIYAFIHGPSDTPYQGGVFHVKLTIGEEYPTIPPKAYFLTKIFHPNVSATGEICVNTLKKDWTSDLGIKHILLTIKCLLIVPNAESALNEEAGKLLLEHYDDYFQRAKMITEIYAQAHHKVKARSKEEENLTEKHATEKYKSKPLAEENKIKEKKKTLKRL